MINIKLMEIEQPIGTFYFGKIKMSQLKLIAFTRKRKDNIGIQRQIKDKKVSDISYYCKDPDAIFPTPIILNINTDKEIQKLDEGLYSIILDENDEKDRAEIIDGQHRFDGINDADLNDIFLPIVVMFNLNESEKAYIFSTINNNQTKVDKSLIYDLFGLAETRSPYKTCHEIARMLNTMPESPFCGKIKMLEKRQSKEESLSQGTFVSQLLKLISQNANNDTVDSKNNVEIKDNNNFVLRKYYKNNQDSVIAKILMNYFSAAKEVFIKEWNDDNYILTKTTGYSGLIKALKILIPKGESEGDLSKQYFLNIFNKLRITLSEKQEELNSEYFPSGAVGETKLYNYLTN